MRLGMLLREKPHTLINIEWNDLQEQAMYIDFKYLQLVVLKQVEEYDKLTVLFEALNKWFHHMILSNKLYTHFNMMILKMKNSRMKI